MAGIKINNIVLLSFILSGMTTALAAVTLASRIYNIDGTIGEPYLFDVLTVVVLGGISLFGGVGNIYKVALGLLLFGVLNNSMILLGVSFEYQQMIKGIIFIIAVLYDNYNKKKRFQF